MTVVVDASALVPVLIDAGTDGQVVASALAGAALAAPELLPFEVGNVLRRLESTRQISAETAALAHADLLDLSLQLWPYSAVGAAAFGLRKSISVYDAAYVALATQLDAPLVTLDRRLARAASRTCHVLVPGRS